jgi:hypothetical protein
LCDLKELEEESLEKDMNVDDKDAPDNNNDNEIQEDPVSSELQQEDDGEDFDPDSVVSDAAFWHVSCAF